METFKDIKNSLIIDCFAGGGGASVGIEMALGRQVDIAVNHDPKAILMHSVNHETTMHLTEDIFKVDLKKYVGDRHVALLWASPDCTSHSKAKGGQPRKSGLRILPWAVYEHTKKILPDVICMENVEEIQEWGPLDAEGHPIKERKGEEYRKFISSMCALGYDFDSRVLVAADYGAPTTRKRWYAVFRRDGKPIVWPKQTHAKDPVEVPDKMKQWKSCGDYVDWSDLGTSIFGRSKEFAESTKRRIVAGIDKFIINCDRPYIVTNRAALEYAAKNHVKGPDLSAFDLNDALTASFITKYYKSGIGQTCFDPCHTITTSAGHFGLVTAFLIKYYGTGGGQALTDPLATITTKDRFALVNTLIEYNGNQYVIADVFLRMLKPQELKLMQGFPEDYIIDHDNTGKKISKSDQVKRIGNSVVPTVAQALITANCGYLKVGERKKKIVA